MSALDAMTPKERRAIEALAGRHGLQAEAVAAQMAAAFLRLALDAPSALPVRPMGQCVDRARRVSLAHAPVGPA